MSRNLENYGEVKEEGICAQKKAPTLNKK